MNNCPKCGNPLQTGTESCPICGTNILASSTVVPAPGPTAVASVAPVVPAPAPVAPTPVVEAAPAPAPVAPTSVVEAAPAPAPVAPAPVVEAAPAPAPVAPAPVVEVAPAPAPVAPTPVVEAAPAPAPVASAPVVEAAPAPAPVAPTPVVEAAPAPAPVASAPVVEAAPAPAPVAPTPVVEAAPAPAPVAPTPVVEAAPAPAPVASAPVVEAAPAPTPKKKNNKTLLIVILVIVVLGIGGFLLTRVNLGGTGGNVPKPNQPQQIASSMVTSNGFKFNLEDNWMVQEDGRNVIITNADGTVVVKLENVNSNFSKINAAIISKYFAGRADFKDSQVEETKISAKDAYLVNASSGDMPVQIYYINGGTSLTLGATIIYQSQDSKDKYVASVTELIGTVSYSDDSLKAISTIEMYSSIFNAYNGVFEYALPDDVNVPSDNDVVQSDGTTVDNNSNLEQPSSNNDGVQTN